MEVLKVQKGQIVAKKNDKVKEWYFIQEGSVIQKYAFVELELKQNGIVGILENDRFLCDYIAAEDSALAVFPCESSEDLQGILSNDAKIRRYFLKAAIEQRQQMLQVYAGLEVRCKQFHTFIETFYNDYKTICNQYQLEEQPFSKMDYFHSLEMRHKAEKWEMDNSSSLVTNYLEEYLNLLEKDDSLCVGAIIFASGKVWGYMQFVRSQDLKPGMRLAKPIYNKMGVLLYERNTKLTLQSINSIDNFGLIGIFILEPAEPVPPLSKEDLEFEQFQTIYMFKLKDRKSVV